MKSRVINLIIATLVVIVLAPSSVFAQGLSFGDAIVSADATLENANGDATSIASQKGENGTVVVFWCQTCPWVAKYEERMVATAAKYSAQGFGFVAINSNDAEAYPGDGIDKMTEQSTKHGYTFPYLVDEGSAIATAFGAKRTPHVFVFNGDNALVYRGAIDDSPSSAAKVEETFLANALDSLAAGNEVAVNDTKAFGCTIKFSK